MTTRFVPCVVIPTYDNPITVGAVTRAVREYVPDILVIDDGSAMAGQQAVEALRSLPGVVVHRRARNGGKGAAVRDGLEMAKTLGFSHSLQIDADGQHAVEDVPTFLDAARRRPEALVVGSPVFDDSAPLSRVLGRRLTRFWTRVETYGRRVIHDPLCGFRVYPVDAALDAGARFSAMDFDPEIAVRMIWNGVPVINVPTRIRYLKPEHGGVSHFRIWHDNVLISRMHTTLVIEAVVRKLVVR
jgi:glycosyltransferase involved in cell wall biosynthesis